MILLITVLFSQYYENKTVIILIKNKSNLL